MDGLKKDRECAECEHLFDCKGKPENVKRCLNLKKIKNVYRVKESED